MKIKRINEIDPVKFTGGISFRMLLESDNMGFSVMKTVIPKGGPHHWHYPEHLEACYCIKGIGELVDLSSGIKHLITPDVCYVLDKHDDHTFEAKEDVILISIFNPPLVGTESHNADGHYSAGQYNKNRAWEIVKATKSIDSDYDLAEYIENFLNGKTA
jgi:L-ectoine synthase